MDVQVAVPFIMVNALARIDTTGIDAPMHAVLRRYNAAFQGSDGVKHTEEVRNFFAFITRGVRIQPRRSDKARRRGIIARKSDGVRAQADGILCRAGGYAVKEV